MARLLFGAFLVAAVAARHSGCDDCPWLQSTGQKWWLECNDGTFQSWFTGDPTDENHRECEKYYDFKVCNNHGGRKRCPQGQVMCATKGNAAGGTDYMCVGARDDGLNPCTNPLAGGGLSDPLYAADADGSCGDETLYQDTADANGVRTCPCSWRQDTGIPYHVLCNDGLLASWFTGGDLTCEDNYDFSVCNDHGGRARCPPGHTMCASPNLAAGNTDHLCIGGTDCTRPIRGPSDPWFQKESGTSGCLSQVAYADGADPLGNRKCDDSSSSEKSLLLLLLLLLLLIPLLCCCCLLFLCCIRGKKKGPDTTFAHFDSVNIAATAVPVCAPETFAVPCAPATYVMPCAPNTTYVDPCAGPFTGTCGPAPIF